MKCFNSMDEIKEVVFGSYAAGAPGQDGFSFLFLLEVLGVDQA